MKSMVFAVAALLSAADALLPSRILANRATPAGKNLQLPSEPAMLQVTKTQGCFSSKGDLTLNGTYIYNSLGACGQDICATLLKKKVGATSGGNQCWCGDTYPPANTRVDDDKCDVGCTGYDKEACGGVKYYTVYNTGLTLDVDFAGGNDAKASGSDLPIKPTQTPVDPAKTTIVSSAPPTEEKSKGSNTAGIAAGVVVGVVVLSALGVFLFFHLRRKKNREIEEEHRRNAAVNSFMGKPPSSSGMSITDSRLDPVMAQRRMSDGSIADNQDYSRRILRVTNA